MDKIAWLQDMARKNPTEAQGWYWLGKEQLEHGDAIGALQSFTEGLRHSDDSLRGMLLTELSNATAALQTGAAKGAPAVGPDLEGGRPGAGTEAAAASNTAGASETATKETSSVEQELQEVTQVTAAVLASVEQFLRETEDYRKESSTGGQLDSSVDLPAVVGDVSEGGAASSADIASSEVDAGTKEEGLKEPEEAWKPRGKPGLHVLHGGLDSASAPEPAPDKHRITFADVAGLADLKKAIQMRIISPFYNQGLFSRFRKKTGGGVLLYGPPGCGKTFIARATAGECKANFINVHITDILDPYIGVSESNLLEIFEKARHRKPSVMFFDEIDAIGFNRSKSSSHMRGLVDTLLTQMEGMDTSTDQVLVIGATNMPWDVDNALKRPGRFDRLIFVAPPDEVAREQMFRLKLSGRYVGIINCARLAERTEFFSGADIENVCERAAEYVLGEIMDTGVERPIEQRDVERAIEETQPSTLEWMRTAKNYVKYSNQSGLYNDVEQYLKKHSKRI
nr:ATP-binding protein [Paenibacillus turpanensis]